MQVTSRKPSSFDLGFKSTAGKVGNNRGAGKVGKGKGFEGEDRDNEKVAEKIQISKYGCSYMDVDSGLGRVIFLYAVICICTVLHLKYHSNILSTGFKLAKNVIVLRRFTDHCHRHSGYAMSYFLYG